MELILGEPASPPAPKALLRLCGRCLGKRYLENDVPLVSWSFRKVDTVLVNINQF
jgi:hypothetical protein